MNVNKLIRKFTSECSCFMDLNNGECSERILKIARNSLNNFEFKSRTQKKDIFPYSNEENKHHKQNQKNRFFEPIATLPCWFFGSSNNPDDDDDKEKVNTSRNIDRLLTLEKRLNEKLKGQSEAVAIVTEVIKKNYCWF